MISRQWAIRHQTIRKEVLGVNTDTDYAPYLLGKPCFPYPHIRQSVPISPPKFRQAQRVSFVGGIGTIRSRRLESGMWAYAVEMSLGMEPDVGRVGTETTIFLHEADIQVGCTGRALKVKAKPRKDRGSSGGSNSTGYPQRY